VPGSVAGRRSRSKAICRRDAHYEYAQKIHQWFPELEAALQTEIVKRVAEAQIACASDPAERVRSGLT
jgi:hypothetical protein